MISQNMNISMNSCVIYNRFQLSHISKLILFMSTSKTLKVYLLDLYSLYQRHGPCLSSLFAIWQLLGAL